MWNGKRKALTFSYDDGVEQDKRLIGLFDKYGMKATFNLNPGLMGKNDVLVRDGVKVEHFKMTAEEAVGVYAHHEVAAHTMTHPNLTQVKSDEEVVREVEESRITLGKLFGREIVGFAFPGGMPNNDERTRRLVREKTGVKYARSASYTGTLAIPEDLIGFEGSEYHHADFAGLEAIAKRFLEDQSDTPLLLYVWGHSYEFDIRNEWDRMERLLDLLAGHEDVFYGTNAECLLGDGADEKNAE